MRSAILAAALLAATAAAAQAQTGIAAPRWGLAELMAGLARAPGGTLRFEERRTLAIATTPLLSSGVLRFQRPALLEKQTLLPSPGSFTIAGDLLTVTQGSDAARHISLQQVPQLQALVLGLRATLDGDAATLNRLFDISLFGTEASWQLRLRPRDTGAELTELRITGSGALLQSVATREASGDSSNMLLWPAPP